MKSSALSYNSPGTVSGVFFTKKDADKAYNALIRRGHTQDDISVLMSDETLGRHENPASDANSGEEETGINVQIGKAANAISDAIISFTSMISLPGLGIAISNTLLKKISWTDQSESTADHVIGSRIPEEHTDSYGGSMKEGGIIISVDPRNAEEKKAIVKDFKENNGHDILGDDGYTELG